MKTDKIMLATILSVMVLCSAGCTDEFKYTIPPKYPSTGPEEPVVYDVTFNGLLDELVTLDEIAKYPAIAYTSHQASSYDRLSVTPGTPDWFANYDGLGFVRKETNEGRKETVMMDHEGPGVITRIWLTSLDNKDAVIRFYFNGSKTPDWTVGSFNMKDFDADLQEQGSARPLGMGFVQPISAWIRGTNLWLPIPYSKGCKVTFEEKSTAANPTRYFQINYRAYPEGTNVETFSQKLFNASREKVSAANSQMTDPKGKVSGRVLTADEELAPDAVMKLDLTAGSNAVMELRFEVTGAGANYEEVMDNLIFLSKFDGRLTAGLPLADLSTGGPGSPAVSNYLAESSGSGNILLRFLMPYAQTGTLAVRNESGHTVKVKMSARVGSFKRDNRTLYFHAAAKSEDNVRIPLWNDYANCFDWNFATIRGGRGVLRADMFSMNNHTYNWPGEGDEKIWVDDETFPSHFGTGVEDYYGFCSDLGFQYPFVGEPRLDSDNWDFHGVNTYYRIRSLDGIPFTSKLRFDLEMEGHEAGNADLRNAIFWYGDLATEAVGMKQYTFE